MQRKYNIPIFVPHKGCPFDCVFCNQNRITGSIKEVTPDDVTDTIESYLKTLPESGADIETAFFGGSFTGIPIEEQTALMERVKPYISSGRIKGIRLSTRPDYIDDEILTNLKNHGVTTIELGVQSMCGEVLKKSNRGHSAEQVVEASRLIKAYGFGLGLQMMTGLPGDTRERSLYTARRIAELEPVCVRIYPTLTIKGTYLEKMYQSGEYTPQTLDEAVSLAKELLLIFERAGIEVIRMGLQPTEEINEHASVVAGPFHSTFGELVEGEIYYDMIIRELEEMESDVIVYVNPREISKAVGNGRRNITRLMRLYGHKISIKGDSGLKKREVRAVAAETA